MSRVISFTQAINEALIEAMKKDPKVLFYALGADDPKRIFGTAADLKEKFGPDRVFDMPASENAMTGIGVGAALEGYRPVMAHQRLDFFLLAMDQLVNNAAKWHFMFGGQENVPITIRLITGRGWGQGPTHSQTLHAWFAHIPGLKVVMPATAHDAKGLLYSSIMDENPVVFLEHRWLHQQVGDVPAGSYSVPLGQANVVHPGKDLTIVAISLMVPEALRAAAILQKQGISCEIIDPRTIAPMDWATIEKSVKKTGRLIVMDTAQESFGVASEIVSHVTINCFRDLKAAPLKLATPHHPVPTTFGLTDQFYPDAKDVLKAAGQIFEKNANDWLRELPKPALPHDVPGDWFKGPF